MTLKHIKAHILTIILIIIPFIFLILLTTRFQEQILVFENIFIIGISILTLIAGWLFTALSLKSVLGRKSILNLKFNEQIITVAFGFILSWVYTSFLTVMIGVLSNQEKTRIIILILGCITFLIIYPLIELYNLASDDKNSSIPGQKYLESLVEFVKKKTGNKRIIAAIITYFLIIIFPIILISLFIGLLTSLILWTLILPILYLGILTGVKSAKDILKWRLIRTLHLKDYRNLGFISVNYKKDKRVWRIFPNIKFKGLLILIYGTIVLGLSIYTIIIEFQLIILGITLVGALNLLSIFQVLVIKGRGAILETIESWERWKPQILRRISPAFLVIFPAFIGVALFSILSLEIVVNAPEFLQNFMILTGLAYQLNLLRIILLLDNFLIVSLMIFHFFFPSKMMRINLVDVGVMYANKEKNWRPIIQLLKFNDKFKLLKWTKESIDIRLRALKAVTELKMENIPENFMIEIVNSIILIIYDNKWKRRLNEKNKYFRKACDIQKKEEEMRKQAIDTLDNILENRPPIITTKILHILANAGIEDNSFLNDYSTFSVNALYLWFREALGEPSFVTPEMLFTTLQGLTILETIGKGKVEPPPKLLELRSFKPWTRVIEKLSSQEIIEFIYYLLQASWDKMWNWDETYDDYEQEVIIETLYDTLTHLAKHVNDVILKHKIKFITEKALSGNFPHLKAWKVAVKRFDKRIPEKLSQIVDQGIMQEENGLYDKHHTELLKEEVIQNVFEKIINKDISYDGEYLNEWPDTLNKFHGIVRNSPKRIKRDLVMSIIQMINSDDPKVVLPASELFLLLTRYIHSFLTPDLLKLMVPSIIDHDDPNIRFGYYSLRVWHKLLRRDSKFIKKEEFNEIKKKMLHFLIKVLNYADFECHSDRAYWVWDIILRQEPNLITEELDSQLPQMILDGKGGIQANKIRACFVIIEKRPDLIQKNMIQTLIEALTDKDDFVKHAVIPAWTRILKYRPKIFLEKPIQTLIKKPMQNLAHALINKEYSVNEYANEFWDTFLQNSELLLEFRPPYSLKYLCEYIVSKFSNVDYTIQESLVGILEKIRLAFLEKGISTKWLSENVPPLEKSCKREIIKPRIKAFQDTK